ncbi:hypothetical protein OG21DRAFT_1511247 [Imleria badia]|nr:hypothetical protein OG21DRAFT_1511247 [Imleria badia]
MMVTALRSLVLLRLQVFGCSADFDKSTGLLEEIVQTTPDDDLPSLPPSLTSAAMNVDGYCLACF